MQSGTSINMTFTSSCRYPGLSIEHNDKVKFWFPTSTSETQESSEITIEMDPDSSFRVKNEKGRSYILIINDCQYPRLDKILDGESEAYVEVTIDKDKKNISITQMQTSSSCCLWLKIMTGALMCSASLALLIFFPHLAAASLGLKFALGGSFFTGVGLFAHGCYQRSCSIIEPQVELLLDGISTTKPSSGSSPPAFPPP